MEKMKLEELIELYRVNLETMTEWDKAVLESQIWDLRATKEGPGVSRLGERREWFQNKFGGTYAQYERRAALYHARDWTQPLWEKIKGGSSLNDVYNYYKRAKELGKLNGKPGPSAFRASLELVLVDKNAGLPPPVVVVKPVPEQRAVPSPKEKEEEPAPEPKEAAHRRPVDYQDVTGLPQISNSKEYLRRMKELTDDFVRSSLGDIDPYQADILTAEFMGWIREAYDDLRRKVSKYRQEANSESTKKRVSKEAFKRACEVLSFRGTFGKPIDLRAAKKRMFVRARDLHPDSNEGSTEKVAEYDAVQKAYRVLEQYTEEVTQ